jgi:catechol 2,3-dioxygenase-like lactoylglutathione lyase family enzyme
MEGMRLAGGKRRNKRYYGWSESAASSIGGDGVLGHISFGVGDLSRSSAFYDAAMGALGYARVHTGERSIGYGMPSSSADRLLLILQDGPVIPPGKGFHLAFVATDREAVARFHAAALANGGLDLGPPGPRPQYGPNYFAAFVLDPDGYKLEAKYPPPGA